MKIGFTGAGNTGKTTTAKALSVATGLSFYPGVSRGVFKELGYQESDQRNLSRTERWKIQKKILRRKETQEHRYPEGVFDRTSLCHLAYLLYRCSDAVGDEEICTIIGTVHRRVLTYDYIFYSPIYDWKNEDGFRENNLAYREVIDSIVLGLLRKFNVSYYSLSDCPVEVKVQSILHIIES